MIPALLRPEGIHPDEHAKHGALIADVDAYGKAVADLFNEINERYGATIDALKLKGQTLKQTSLALPDTWLDGYDGLPFELYCSSGVMAKYAEGLAQVLAGGISTDQGLCCATSHHLAELEGVIDESRRNTVFVDDDGNIIDAQGKTADANGNSMPE